MTAFPPRPGVEFVISEPSGKPSGIFSRFLLQLLAALSERSTIATSDVAPTIDDIPAGEWRVWKNTSDATVKLYANDGGALVATTLS